MSRKFITSILIAAVTVTGISFAAAPARAGNDDLAKLLFGATALAIVGTAIANGRESESTRSSKVNKHVHAYPKPGHVSPHRPEAVRRKAPVFSKSLPASCLRRHAVKGNHSVSLIGKRCVQNHYRHADRLPRHCQTRVQASTGAHSGYNMYCLRQNGYTLAAY